MSNLCKAGGKGPREVRVRPPAHSSCSEPEPDLIHVRQHRRSLCITTDKGIAAKWSLGGSASFLSTCLIVYSYCEIVFPPHCLFKFVSACSVFELLMETFLINPHGMTL